MMAVAIAHCAEEITELLQGGALFFIYDIFNIRLDDPRYMMDMYPGLGTMYLVHHWALAGQYKGA